MKFEEEGRRANFRIFIRELGAISALENDEVIEILSNLSTHLKEYKKKPSEEEQ